MESKYFKEGVLVDVYTDKSHLPQKKYTILEVHSHGIVCQQKGIADSPVKFFSFARAEIEFVPEVEKATISRSSGAKK